jgi:hypothetical protein
MRAWRSARSKAKAREAAAGAASPFAPYSFAPPPVGAPPPVPSQFLPPPAFAPPPPAAPEPPPTPAAEAATIPPVEAEAPATVAPLEIQTEFLRLLSVVTSMCDHVIEYIEADRAERRVMIETLAQLSRMITSASPAVIDAAATPGVEVLADPSAGREHVIGGSMPAGPEPLIDLREPAPAFESEPDLPLGMEPEVPLGIEPEIRLGIEPGSDITPEMEIAVEVKGRFGDRWVDGFEICAVMATADGPRYRLRRHRDGVVLPELFDATSIRHVETFEQLNGEHLNAEPRGRDRLNGSPGYWSRS